MNPLHHAMPAGHFEVPVGFDGDTPDIGADMHPFGDHCPRHIPGLETQMVFAALAIPDGKPSLIYPTHLPIAMTVGSDEQWHDAPEKVLIRGTRSYTDGIMPVRLLQASCHTIEFGAPTSPTLHR